LRRKKRIKSDILLGAAVGIFGGIVGMALLQKILYPNGNSAEYFSASSDFNLQRRAKELYEWLQAGQALLIEIE